MRSTALAILLSLLVATAGCFGKTEGAKDEPATPPANATPDTGKGEDNDTFVPPKLVVEGPAWKLGDAWTLDVAWSDERGNTTWELVTFLDDGEHYWLGTPERTQSIRHALEDINPLIGRIHVGILSPHESGRHAGMYKFPLTDGTTWQGFFFGEEWTFTATEGVVEGGNGSERGFHIEGKTASGAATLRLDYVPSEKWFRHLEIRGAAGGDVTLTVTERATKSAGTYYFHRGPMVYSASRVTVVGPPVEETFAVEETQHLALLAVTLQGSSGGPLTVQFLDPDGKVAYQVQETTPTSFDKRIEIPAPKPGEWTVRYVAVGSANISATVWALDEHAGTLGA